MAWLQERAASCCRFQKQSGSILYLRMLHTQLLRAPGGRSKVAGACSELLRGGELPEAAARMIWVSFCTKSTPPCCWQRAASNSVCIPG